MTILWRLYNNVENCIISCYGCMCAVLHREFHGKKCRPTKQKKKNEKEQRKKKTKQNECEIGPLMEHNNFNFIVKCSINTDSELEIHRYQSKWSDFRDFFFFLFLMVMRVGWFISQNQREKKSVALNKIVEVSERTEVGLHLCVFTWNGLVWLGLLKKITS